LAQDELGSDDKIYEVGTVKLIYSKKLERDAEYIGIDYENYYWGQEFIVTTQF